MPSSEVSAFHQLSPSAIPQTRASYKEGADQLAHSEIKISAERRAAMKTKLLHQENGFRTFAVVFEKNEDVREPLLAFAREQGISGAQVTAIGAFNEATLAYFDRQARQYKEIPVQEQVEVLSLAGNLGRQEEKPVLHAHAVVSRADGTTLGGHFLRGKVWPTLEMIILETPQFLHRVHDEETGLALIDLTA
jgi:predicted DNA-binding protein with PD1-like motif